MSYLIDLFNTYLGYVPESVTWETLNPFELVRYLGGVVMIVAVVFAIIYFVILFLRFLLKR